MTRLTARAARLSKPDLSDSHFSTAASFIVSLDCFVFFHCNKKTLYGKENLLGLGQLKAAQSCASVFNSLGNASGTPVTEKSVKGLRGRDFPKKVSGKYVHSVSFCRSVQDAPSAMCGLKERNLMQNRTESMIAMCKCAIVCGHLLQWRISKYQSL